MTFDRNVYLQLALRLTVYLQLALGVAKPPNKPT